MDKLANTYIRAHGTRINHIIKRFIDVYFHTGRGRFVSSTEDTYDGKRAVSITEGAYELMASILAPGLDLTKVPVKLGDIIVIYTAWLPTSVNMLYFEGARIIGESDAKKSSVKSLCLSSKFKNKKQLFALVCETLKYRPIIATLLEKTKLLKLERCISSKALGEVLIYDLVFGKGVDNAPKKIKDAIKKHQSALHSELARIKVKSKATKNEDLLSDNIKSEVALPRFVRVNLLKTTVEDVIEHFKTEGYTFAVTRGVDYERYKNLILKLKSRQFARDIHLPELLVFAPKTDLHAHVLYTRGDIILQDKASCLPAHMLSPSPGSHVIDCCAAPGNKTTHAAACMQNKGKIYSFDLDARRLATMGTLTLKAGVLCAELIHKNFLQVNPTDSQFSQVSFAIVDPSCSGSGIVSRMNSVTDDDQSITSQRLQNLSKFQQNILSHALTFPAMKRVVYSTCSIHAQENEQVVENVLKKFKNKYELESALPAIPSRGDSSYLEGDKCVRLSPEKDGTNGFFVACFVRKECEGEDEDEVCYIESNVSTQHSEMNITSNEEPNSTDVAKSKKSKKDKRKDKATKSNEIAPETDEQLVLPVTEASTISSEDKLISKKKRKRKRKQNDIATGDDIKKQSLQPCPVKVPKTDLSEDAQGKKRKKQKKHRRHKPVTS